ncbi:MULTISPECIES: hypothetical protein [unclassified Cupriavidus]|uniref:hypothetical protein n=1 Tax=unclassified Cupriavidus TaxID=2640874 RepID=UPI00313D54C3
MQETRQMGDTVFELRTYRSGLSDWNWEVTHRRAESDEAAKIHGVGHLGFLEEKDAFEAGQQHLGRLLAGEV